MNMKSTNRQDGPQSGPIAKAADSPIVVRAGAAPKDKGAKAPGIKMRAGSPPPGPKSGSAERNVRSGSDPRGGSLGASTGTPIDARGGSAPKGGMAPAGARSPSQQENMRAHYGRSGYAKGGVVQQDSAYAKGGKVNRHGVEPKKNDGDADDAYAKGGKVKVAGGGNGGLPGGNAAIPLAQPGGTPSTGVVAGGTLPMTSDTLGTESTMKAPKLRSAALKRAGSAPSLPRPRR